MRIGIDIRSLMDRHYSGVSEYTRNLLGELFRIDTENEYVLFYNSGRDLSGRIPRFDFPNVSTVNTRYPNKLFNNIMMRLLKWPKIDRLLQVDLFFMPNIAFIALSKKCRRILTVHDLSFLRYPQSYSLKRRLWHRLMAVPSLFRKYDRLIAVSGHTKRDISALAGIAPDRIKRVYSGIGGQYRPIKPRPDELHVLWKKYGLPGRFILSLGTLEPRKNIDGLIAAFDRLKKDGRYRDLHLVVAGATGWRSGPIRRAWQGAENRRQIHFIGYVDTADKPLLYNLAEVFAYLSFYEGFGFPPLEALRCGTPVVAANASSLPELIGSSALLVDPFNIAEIEAALTETLKAGPAVRSRAGRGLSRARELDWSKTAREFVKVLQN
jgi:glycosyltransferase involved in cell wall biosynthesis